MNDTVTSPRVTGSSQMQGDLWSARARDYAELQEVHFLPLYESVQRRPEIAKSRSCLDVGCGPGLATQVFARTIANVAGIDASAAFIDIARADTAARTEFFVSVKWRRCHTRGYKFRCGDRIQCFSICRIAGQCFARGAPSDTAGRCCCDRNLGLARGL